MLWAVLRSGARDGDFDVGANRIMVGPRAILAFVLSWCCVGATTAEVEWVSLMPDSSAVAEGTLAGDWRLEGDMLVGRAEAGKDAWWRAPGTKWDFELEVEFRVPDATRGGVAFRSHWLPRVSGQGPGPHQMYGYCVAIDAQGEGTGTIGDVNGRDVLVAAAEDSHDALDPEGWNRLSVRAQGGVAEVRINGTVATTLFDEAMIGGLVGLRVMSSESGGGEIHFRSFRILDLGRAGTWRALFDGETLDGWKNWGSERWLVEDGTIQGRRGPKASEGYLATTERWRGFRVRGEFLMLGEGNYGLFYHSTIRLREDGYPMISGVQCEVKPSYPGSTGWHYESYRRGWLIRPDTAQVAAYALRPKEWNAIEIRSVGNRITSWVNGYRVVDFWDRSPQLFEGSFALQLHAGEGVGIDWRALYVSE